MDVKKLYNIIDERKGELFSLLSELVKIDSVSYASCGNEENCARFIEDMSKKLGFPSHVYSPMDIEDFENHPDYVPGRNLDSRYNVSVVYPGIENSDGLLLMAHTDTVEVGDLTSWDKDPLSGIMENGKIFGRGACDDKFGIAVAMFLFNILKEHGFSPRKNIVFCAYCDEEYGGSHGALAAVLKNPCDHIVNMDGDYGQIWHASSGGQLGTYYFHTENTVDNAMLTAKGLSVIIETIEETFAKKRREELQKNEFYKGTIAAETPLRYMEARAGCNGNDLGKGIVQFVFYTDKTQEDIEADIKELEKLIAKRLKPLGICGDGYKPYTRFFHYVHTDPLDEDILLMNEAYRDVTGSEMKVCSSCLSDMSVISKYGSNHAFTCGCGRDFSEVGGAHQPNEFVDCNELVAFTKTLCAYIIKLLG